MLEMYTKMSREHATGACLVAIATLICATILAYGLLVEPRPPRAFNPLENCFNANADIATSQMCAELARKYSR